MQRYKNVFFFKMEIYIYKSAAYADIDVGKNVAELPCRFSLLVFIFLSQSMRIFCIFGELGQDSE